LNIPNYNNKQSTPQQNKVGWASQPRSRLNTPGWSIPILPPQIIPKRLVPDYISSDSIIMPEINAAQDNQDVPQHLSSDRYSLKNI
jgi:hypothetical protein